MVSFQNFPDFPPVEEVSICEKDGRLCTIPILEITGNSYVLEFYPEINICPELFHGSSIKAIDDRRTVMVPVNEHLLKSITRIFFEDGFVEALKEARTPQNAAPNLVISSISEQILRFIDLLQKVNVTIKPHLKVQGPTSIAKFSETKDWTKSFIRHIKWHPNCFKIAVAAADDTIRIYVGEPALVPILKSVNQKGITSMAWRPFSAAELAVGCQTGILLWTIDPHLQFTRPLSQAVHLKHANHCPVTSVEWSPDGCLLATSSINDSDVLIWDVDQSKNVPLKRVGAPCSLLKWSPDGSRLFSSTVNNVFRVWTTNKWTPERWTIANGGTIQSAAWSPCGSYLLFVTSEDPTLYRLQFIDEQIFTSSSVPKHALPIADLSKVKISFREVGGLPQAIAWDPYGLYLAIIFKDSPCVAIFNTTINRHIFTISPSCFLTGFGTENPSFICFQSKSKKNADSVLTIGWSSGRIQYFPFVFASAK